MRRSTLHRILGRLVGRTRVYRVFAADPAQAGSIDPEIRTFDAAHPPGGAELAAYRRSAGIINSGIMLARLRRQRAVLLTATAGGQLIGYGWLQSWESVRREFWWLADDGVCLGPYWTHPEQRGRGVYGRLLAHSLAECRRRGWTELYIWADAANAASIRGITKAGFRPRGLHEVSVYLCGAIRRHRALRMES